ncbi:hypothetical protein Btru_020846 [Bulinus truncatus]|nr:hypothetical protein Btru_020846 [Bulinus truncatus]
MSARKLEILPSTKKYIKCEQFSQFVSASRLRQVQNILTQRKAGSADIDGILCIAGIDSRYNEGTYGLLNYLLFGFFDVRKEELESSGFPEEVIDDMILLIYCDHVQVYCNPVNYHYLLPYVSHWPGIQFHCLSDDQYDWENDDAAEEFKICSFISMISECKVVGIPYSGHEKLRWLGMY